MQTIWTTCTSTIPSGTTCPTCATASSSHTTDSISCTTNSSSHTTNSSRSYATIKLVIFLVVSFNNTSPQTYPTLVWVLLGVSHHLMVMRSGVCSTSHRGPVPSCPPTKGWYQFYTLVTFQPEFAGKPHKDTKAHLLRTNDWMDPHAFPEGVKVWSFCLTLVGEARLGNQSSRSINVDWNGLQNQFWQQYSKIGNTRTQFFHVWRSFHFNENTETLDSYVTCIRQVATVLGYGEPQVLEVFKNTPQQDYIVYSFLNLTWYATNNIALRATSKAVYTLTSQPGTHLKPTQPWCEYYLVWAITS